MKMYGQKYEKGGTAGIEGAKFQVGLLTVSVLNALGKLSKWRLSTENKQAGKFDDLVLERPGGAILLQAKYREKKTKIILQELLSTNSKKDDFSLPKYFFSYLEVKDRFTLKNLIICTNAGINEEVLKFLEPQKNCSENILYCQEDALFYTLKEEILPELKEKSKIYCQQNLNNRGIDESIITDENLKGFLKYLQLYFNYPAGDDLEKSIEKLLRRAGWLHEVSPSEIYGKVMDWFRQKNGEFITELHVKAMFSEIKGDKYWQSLEGYHVFFQDNDLNFQNTKKCYHFIADKACLLQEIRLYRGLHDKKKVLCIFRDDDIENQKQLIQAFGLRGYVYLIIFWPKLREEFLVKEMWDEIKEILDKYQYKKIILLTEGNNKLFRQIQLPCHSVNDKKEPPTFQGLSEETQNMLLRRKNIIFQGNAVNLEELFFPYTIKDYEIALNLETLEKLVRNEQIKVGSKLRILDENIRDFYITRNFLRGNEKIEEENMFDVREKVILISDSAGIGKTTVLTKLASIIKEKNPQLWVLKIELCHYSKVLKDLLRKKRTTINITELLDSQEATKLTYDFEKFIFSTDNKVVLMLDGVDEISPNYIELIANLLANCEKAPNLAKIVITTQPHLIPILKKRLLQVNPFKLEPFSERDQLDFLTSYWAHNLKLDHTSKQKCEYYAKALMSSVTSWLKLSSWEENSFGMIPLHMRMLAEIFEEKSGFEEIAHWEGCKEFLNADRLEPNLPEKVDISKLYKMFLEKKQTVFVDKGNPSGNASAEEALIEQFDECLEYHRMFALKVILNREDRENFTCYKKDNKNALENVLKIGIIQEENNKLHFLHRTFAEFFVAECLIEELHQNQNTKFQKFLIDGIFQNFIFANILHFFDNLLGDYVGNLPNDIFQNYRSLSYEIYLVNYDFPSFIHYLAKQGCVSVLQLVLKCVNFKVIKDKQTTVSELYENICKDVDPCPFSGNRLDILQFFVQRGGVNIKDGEGNTPLHLASYNGHLKMAKFLVEQGAIVDMGVMSKAVRGGHVNIIKFLVELGVDIKTIVEWGEDVYDAILQNHVKVTTYLLEKILGERGIECCLNVGYSMIPFAAAYLGRIDILKTLLERGLDINCKILNKQSLIFGAAMGGQLETIEYLAWHGVDINSKDVCNNTALHVISRESSHMHVAEVLLKLGIDVNIKNNDGRTALYQTVEAGTLDMVKLLVKNGADVNLRDSFCNRTALYTATLRDDLEIVKLLVEHNADINIKDIHGDTLLHLLSESGRLDTIKYLVKFGVDITIENDDGNTALHVALINVRFDVAKFLVECGSDVNAKNHDGETALHLVLVQRVSILTQLGIVRFFVEHGANIDARNNIGQTVLHTAILCYAKKYDFYGYHDPGFSIIKFLTEQGATIDIEQSNEDFIVTLAKKIQQCSRVYSSKSLRYILQLPLFRLLGSLLTFDYISKRTCFKKGVRRIRFLTCKRRRLQTKQICKRNT